MKRDDSLRGGGHLWCKPWHPQHPCLPAAYSLPDQRWQGETCGSCHLPAKAWVQRGDAETGDQVLSCASDEHVLTHASASATCTAPQHQGEGDNGCEGSYMPCWCGRSGLLLEHCAGVRFCFLFLCSLAFAMHSPRLALPSPIFANPLQSELN